MQRREHTEMWTTQGRHPQDGQYVNTTGPQFSGNTKQGKAKEGKNTRDWGIWLLLGLLFLKFSVLLVLMSLMFVHFNSRTLELQRDVENLRKILPFCESGWLEFEGHCYLFSEVELNWTRSEEMCNDSGSQLVVIDSEAEQKFIMANCKGVSWIGLSDMETEGTFTWVDGTELSYTFWDSGEPNDLGGKEDCVHTYSDGWNDSICELGFYSICEKRLL